MDRRLTPPLRASALALSALLLAGCWTSRSDDGSGGGTAADTPSAAATGQTSMGAPAPACPPGDASASYECAGVTVTGAKDEEPTITLGPDFPPATELIVADVYEGSGDPVAPGAALTVNYVGVGQTSGEVFDSSWARGAPATFPLDGVIEGWQQGMLGMKPGGRRLLVIPGSLAYGEAGAPPAIGPDETLVFVVDLIEQTPAS